MSLIYFSRHLYKTPSPSFSSSHRMHPDNSGTSSPAPPHPAVAHLSLQHTGDPPPTPTPTLPTTRTLPHTQTQSRRAINKAPQRVFLCHGLLMTSYQYIHQNVVRSQHPPLPCTTLVLSLPPLLLPIRGPFPPRSQCQCPATCPESPPLPRRPPGQRHQSY